MRSSTFLKTSVGRPGISRDIAPTIAPVLTSGQCGPLRSLATPGSRSMATASRARQATGAVGDGGDRVGFLPMADDDLHDFERDYFTDDDVSRTVYRQGTGPAVIVIAEIPGITPKV